MRRFLAAILAISMLSFQAMPAWASGGSFGNIGFGDAASQAGMAKSSMPGGAPGDMGGSGGDAGGAPGDMGGSGGGTPDGSGGGNSGGGAPGNMDGSGGTPDGSGGGAPGDMGGGTPGGDMGGGAPADSAPSEATSDVYINSTTDLTGDLEAELANFTYASDNYSASGITFDGFTGTATVGGGSDLYDAEDIEAYVKEQGLSGETQETTAHYVDYLGDSSVAGFIVLGAADSADSSTAGNVAGTTNTTTATSGSPGNAITTTAGTIYVKDMYLQTSGAVNAASGGRYALATMGNNSATSVVKNSYVIQTGQTQSTSNVEEPGSNDGLLISGHGRAKMSVGNTSTYYINSSVITEGWAAMSTDSASNDGLYLYAYNSDAIAEDGGYGTYADSGCHDYLYGTRLTSAEVGMIISNNGVVAMSDTDSAPEAVNDYLEASDKAQSNIRSTVTAGRNDAQIHSPGMNMGGNSGMGANSAAGGNSGMGVTDSANNNFTLDLSHTDLVTTTDLETTEDYESKYSTAVADYLDLVGGANILVKSTYGTITLDDVTATSYKKGNGSSAGVLLMTALNSDSSSRYVTGGETTTVTADIKNCNDLSGDILNYDYQRAVDVTLADSYRRGAANSWSRDDWNKYWANLGVTENNADDAVYWILGDEYERDGGTDTTISLTDSVWIVTDDSTITDLEMDDPSFFVVNDGATLTVESGTWAGTYRAGEVVGSDAYDEYLGNYYNSGDARVDFNFSNSPNEAQFDVVTIVSAIVGCVFVVAVIVVICAGTRRKKT